MSGSTTPNYPGLFTEISLAKYNGQTDATIATGLTTVNISVPQDVPCPTLEFYLRSNQLYHVLTTYSQGATSATVNTAIELLGFMSSEHMTTIPFNSVPAFGTACGALLNALVAASLFTAAQQSAILAFTTTEVSRAQQLGFPNDPVAMVQSIAAARVVA